jgi:hypothetical protein
MTDATAQAIFDSFDAHMDRINAFGKEKNLKSLDHALQRELFYCALESRESARALILIVGLEHTSSYENLLTASYLRAASETIRFEIGMIDLNMAYVESPALREAGKSLRNEMSGFERTLKEVAQSIAAPVGRK